MPNGTRDLHVRRVTLQERRHRRACAAPRGYCRCDAGRPAAVPELFMRLLRGFGRRVSCGFVVGFRWL